MDRMFPTDAMYVAARREAANLYAEWERACQMVRDSYTDYAQSKADEFEQDAYDRLVDYVETNELNYSEYDSTRIELGYRLHLKYWGAGIATELAKALVFYGLNDAGLKEICAVTHPDNAASQKVLAKAGFIPHGRAFWYGESLPFFKVSKAQ